MEIPYEHETFRFGAFEWDIAKVREIIGKRNIGDREPDCTVNVEAYARMFLGPKDSEQPESGWVIGLIRVNQEHALSDDIDLDKPVYLAPLYSPDGEWLGNMIIDGWHRVWRARHDGIEHLKAILLTLDEELKARTFRDMRRCSKPKNKKRVRLPRDIKESDSEYRVR